MDTDVETIYVLSPVDDILEHVGLPKTRAVLEKLSPKNVLGRKLGLTSPGEVIEDVVEDIDKSSGGGRLQLPELPRIGR